MTKRNTLLYFLLAVVTGLALLAILVTNAFFPQIILPKPDGMAIILLSLVALVLDFYLSRERRRSFILTPIVGAIIFGVFPLASFVAAPLEAVKLAILGAVIFTVCTYLFDTLTDRLIGTNATCVAPLITAFGMYLAAQCLTAII